MEKVLKSQVKKNLNLQEDYKCSKCRDMTFILDGDTATICECRKLREAERILEISGISDEFRKKIFDNFDYSLSRDVLNAYVKVKTYAKDDVNIMFEIINYRYFNNKPMIISTELSKEKLIGIDEAIGSRILEMCRHYSVELCGRELNYRING